MFNIYPRVITRKNEYPKKSHSGGKTSHVVAILQSHNKLLRRALCHCLGWHIMVAFKTAMMAELQLFDSNKVIILMNHIEVKILSKCSKNQLLDQSIFWYITSIFKHLRRKISKTTV
jgi:hypothetical protein